MTGVQTCALPIYLKQLPLNTLKIDQSFIRDLKPNSKDIEIIKAVISLGQGLNLTIVAEGVESEVQLELLRDLNCNIIQGYFFSPPLPVDKMTVMLQENRRSQAIFDINL